MAKRILLVNKFYYPRGGDCVVTINLRDMLTALGYEVGILTMQYPHNITAPYVHTVPEVTFQGGVGEKLRFVGRMLSGAGVKATFNQVMDQFHPDVVHLHNVHSYLSPAIAKWAKQRGARVVWTLHDYKLLCPSYSCLNHGKPCEKCFSAKWHILKERCFKGSLAASALAWLEAERWNRQWLERWVDAFVCPSEFMRQQMLKGGFSAEKLHTVCNFIDPVKVEALAKVSTIEKQDYYAYIGRLSAEKGVDTLLKAASELPYCLKIAGDGPLGEQLRSQYAMKPNIDFLGHLNAVEVSELQRHARFMVIPSEWYENNPLSVIESECAGTPVLGANIGGIPELISSKCGEIFPMGNASALKQAIEQMMHRDYDYAQIAHDALQRYSAQSHFKKLLPLYFPNH